ncbi:MAG: ABC transporter permease [Puniceicoccales bacterium]|jgi:lipopolysaccharide transport system permease protein|nr:ABC transporter permease [Puniceicoccales bacterium]
MFFQTIRRFADIVFYRTLAGIKSEGRQRYLGYIWFLLEPVLSTAVLYFAYSMFMGRGGPRAILAVFIGMILWQWFEGSVMVGAGAIKAKFHVLNQFNLPKYLFPLVAILVNTWKFLCVSVVIWAGAAAFGFFPNVNWLYLPLLFIVQLLFILGITFPVSIAVTLWSDFQTVIASLFRILFFLSGIFYEPEKIPEQWRAFYLANPMASFIDAGRAVILRNEPPRLENLLPALGVTAALLFLSWLLHLRYDKRILKLTNV